MYGIREVLFMYMCSDDRLCEVTASGHVGALLHSCTGLAVHIWCALEMQGNE